MRLAILSLLAFPAFAQPQPVVRGTASSIVVIGAEGILAEETQPGRWLVRLDTAATQKLIAQEVAASLKSAPIGTPLKGSGSLDFPPMADGTCSADMNFPLAGAVVGDALAPVWPDMEAGLVGQMRVMGPGMVSVRLCYLSSTAVGLVIDRSINPLPKVFGAAVVR